MPKRISKTPAPSFSPSSVSQLLAKPPKSGERLGAQEEHPQTPTSKGFFRKSMQPTESQSAVKRQPAARQSPTLFLRNGGMSLSSSFSISSTIEARPHRSRTLAVV